MKWYKLVLIFSSNSVELARELLLNFLLLKIIKVTIDLVNVNWDQDVTARLYYKDPHNFFTFWKSWDWDNCPASPEWKESPGLGPRNAKERVLDDCAIIHQTHLPGTSISVCTPTSQSLASVQKYLARPMKTLFILF